MTTELARTDAPLDLALLKAVGLDRLAPEGVDINFEQVGGPIMVEVMKRMKLFGRISLCGMISSYNDVTPTEPPGFWTMILMRRLAIRGFIVTDFAPRFGESGMALAGWRILTLNDAVRAVPRVDLALPREVADPELLDFLARRLLAHGWRLKPLHREILLSATYRQSSGFRQDADAVDRAAVAPAAMAQDIKPRTFKLANNNPKNHPMTIGGEKFAEIVAAVKLLNWFPRLAKHKTA